MVNLDHERRAFRAATAAGLALAAALLPATQASAQKPTVAAALKNKAKASPTTASAKCVTLKLKGLECPSCAHQVRQSLMGVAGVQSADVSVSKQTAVVRLAAKNQPARAALTAAVKKAGFDVTAVNEGKVK